MDSGELQSRADSGASAVCGGRTGSLARSSRPGPPPTTAGWTLSPWVYAALFLLLSVAYGVFVFPDQLNHLSLSELKHVSVGPANFLDRAYLPLDSSNYLTTAHESLATILRSAFAVHHLSFGLFSNVTVILIGKIALTLWPAQPLAIVAIANHLLLAATVLQCAAICRHYTIRFERFLPLLLVNPLVLFSLYTLNKEVIGFFLVTAAVRYALERRYWLVGGTVVVALYTRNVLFGFCLAMLLVPWLRRIHWWQLLLAASLVWPLVLYVTHDAPFGSEFGSLDSLAKYFGQQTQRIETFAFQLMKVPLGYVVAWALVIGIDIASPAFNVRYWAGYGSAFNWSELMLQLSSVAFVYLLALTLWRTRFAAPKDEPLFLFFVFTLFAGVFPFSQHRYLLPAFPLLVAAYLVAARMREGEGAGRIEPAGGLRAGRDRALSPRP